MTDIQLIVLRRMRAPLIVLIAAYALAVIGLTLMPGTDPAGRPWRLELFDAFYVMSYTATTIGFGELPHPFSYAQRLWMTLSIYVSVIAWAYALGVIFALVRSAAFREAWERGRFEAGVRRLTERYYVICGYGQSGRRLAEALDRLGYATVVIDPDPDRMRLLMIRDHVQPVVGMTGDARWPQLLTAAGIRRAGCCGVIVLTADDEATQAIAIGARVLAPGLPVIARVRSPLAQQTLQEFGGVTLIQPFETFAFNFGLALDRPDTLRLEDWLTGVPGAEAPPRIEVPRGHWVLAGAGRFGGALRDQLEQSGLTWSAIDPDASRCGSDDIVANGVAADALQRAGIERAIGLVAGTDSDTTNLAIAMAARRMRPDLFVVIRQNLAANRSLIDAARPQLRYVRAQLMTHECLQLLTTPMLNRFLTKARGQGNAWALEVCERLRAVVDERVPCAWRVDCDLTQLGLRHALAERPQPPLTVGHLLRDPDNPEVQIPAIALLLQRDGDDLLLPEPATPLTQRDRVLFVGAADAEALQSRVLNDDVAIDYVRTGREPPRTWLGRWLERMQGGVAPARTEIHT